MTTEPTASPTTAGSAGSTRMDQIRQVFERRQAATIDGYTLDLYTASAIVGVYDALSPANQQRCDLMPLPDLANLALQLLNKRK